MRNSILKYYQVIGNGEVNLVTALVYMNLQKSFRLNLNEGTREMENQLRLIELHYKAYIAKLTLIGTTLQGSSVRVFVGSQE